MHSEEKEVEIEIFKVSSIFVKNGFSRSNLLRRISKKPIRTDAEASLMGHNQNKFDAKKI